MRRILTVASAVLLALMVVAPAALAAPGDVTGITVTSATVDKAGLVVVRGTMYCQNGIGGVEVNGAVTQAIGHKTAIQGGFGGWVDCLSNGPTNWEVASYADGGFFSNGWARLQIQFGMTQCNEFGCWFDWYGGNDFYIKLTK
jgi:hypothetical protein